jgi:phenylalanyl-tRNA synthetase beta chain
MAPSTSGQSPALRSGIARGIRNLAFSLVVRAADRTLTDDEVNAAFAKIQQDITADGRVTMRA